MTFAAAMARHLAAVAAGAALPADVTLWALAELAKRVSGEERRELRDRLLVEAARAILPDGSTSRRATALQVEIEAAERRTGTLDGARALVARALEIDPETPRSHRQLFTILQPGRFRLHATPGESGR